MHHEQWQVNIQIWRQEIWLLVIADVPCVYLPRSEHVLSQNFHGVVEALLPGLFLVELVTGLDHKINPFLLAAPKAFFKSGK